MTNRDVALELLRWLGRGAGDDIERIEQAIDSAKRAGKIEAYERVLQVFRVDFICKGWIERRLADLRAEQAKEPR